jgi:actin-like ATPase involved in cell morphogenesis
MSTGTTTEPPVTSSPKPTGNWTLSIDFGTSYTVAATSAHPSGAEPVLFGSGGAPRMPSSVFVERNGSLTTGTQASNKRQLDPDHFVASPKRFISSGATIVPLASGPVTVSELIAAVFGSVLTRAGERHGDTVPHHVVLTHPADWSADQSAVLKSAAGAAGLGGPELVPEPVAAAEHLGATDLAPGDHIAVYDLGGGTFDAAVLTRDAAGMHVAAVGGAVGIGGEMFDELLRERLGAGALASVPEWRRLTGPPPDRETDRDAYRSWRRDRVLLDEQICLAKESLSDHRTADLVIPGYDEAWTITREELEEVVSEPIGRTVDILAETIRSAGLEARDLKGVYLVGGASRIPLVRTLLGNQLEVAVERKGDPQTVVALGATEALHHRRVSQPAAPQESVMRVAPQPQPQPQVATAPVPPEPPVVVPPAPRPAPVVVPPAPRPAPAAVPPAPQPAPAAVSDGDAQQYHQQAAPSDPQAMYRVRLGRIVVEGPPVPRAARLQRRNTFVSVPGYGLNIGVFVSRQRIDAADIGGLVVKGEEDLRRGGWTLSRPSDRWVPGAHAGLLQVATHPESYSIARLYASFPPFLMRANIPLDWLTDDVVAVGSSQNGGIEDAWAEIDCPQLAALTDKMSECLVTRANLDYKKAYVTTAVVAPAGEVMTDGQFLSTYLGISSAAKIIRRENDTFFRGMPCEHISVMIGSQHRQWWVGTIGGRQARVDLQGMRTMMKMRQAEIFFWL